MGIPVGPLLGMSGVGDEELDPSTVELKPVFSTHAAPATTTMSSEQKETLKLQRALRQINVLEQQRESGEKLEQNQLAKIERKTSNLERLKILGVEVTQAYMA